MTGETAALLDSLVEDYYVWLDGGERRKMSFTRWLTYQSRHYLNNEAKQALAVLKGV